jgi:acyl-CoA reductase-like NAD-dependent aldehyde dehydrogenase
MQELSHYIDGAHVKGASGRFADVMNPATGEVQAKVPLASADEIGTAVEIAAQAQPEWAAMNPQRRARVLMKFVDLLNRDMDKLAEALSREHGKDPAGCRRRCAAGPRGCRVLHRRAAPAEGRIHRRCGSGHRHVLHAPAARRLRGHHAVQLPRHDPDVDVRPGARLRQRLHPEALRA